MRSPLPQARRPVFWQGWGHFLRQLLYFALAYLAYRIVRGLVADDGTLAFQHAREVIAFERSLHLFVEPTLQHAVSSVPTVMTILGWLYINAQFTITVAAMLFLYFYRPAAYQPARDTLLLAMGLALIGYALYPTAPPRFLPEWGFVDSVSDVTGLHLSQSSALFSDFFNPYAAIPSMHVAFALCIALPMARSCRHRLAALLWLCYPALIAFVVVVTGNHFLLDVTLGILTTVLARSLAGLGERLRHALGEPLPATGQASG